MLSVAFLIYPFFLLIVSKQMEKFGAKKDMSRKFVHAGMGLVILFVPFFDHKWVALIPPIIFTIVNAIDLYSCVFSQIQCEEQGNVGTVLYPISYIILIAVFYGTMWWGLAVLGILTMAFGDAGASVFGRAYGKTKYYVSGETRSIVGSGTMFVLTYIIAIVVFLTFPSLGIPPRAGALLAAGFIVAGAATAIEALSIKGTDNLTVPVLTAGATWFLIAVMAQSVMGNQAIVNQPVYQ